MQRSTLYYSLQRGYAELMRQASQERVQGLQAEQDLYKGVTGQSAIPHVLCVCSCIC